MSEIDEFHTFTRSHALPPPYGLYYIISRRAAYVINECLFTRHCRHVDYRRNHRHRDRRHTPRAMTITAPPRLYSLISAQLPLYFTPI